MAQASPAARAHKRARRHIALALGSVAVVLADWPQGRRIVTSAALCLCVAVLIVTVFRGMSDSFLVRAAQTIAIAVAAVGVIGFVIAALTGRLAHYTDPADDDEFEELVRESERLARENLAAEPGEDEFMALDPRNPSDFEELVREALDDLPDLLLRALDHVAVVISDKGRKHRAYGLYQGDTVARDNYPDRIIIFRDTLLRDFGDDPDELRAQVTRTVRHELAHHLGADELGVRELGL
jgi:predicted Zn-dependent protease with MMP-like domain